MRPSKRLKIDEPPQSSSGLEAGLNLCYVPHTAREATVCEGLHLLQRLFVECYDPPAEQIEMLLGDASAAEGALALLLAQVLGLGRAAQALVDAGATYGPWGKDKEDSDKDEEDKTDREEIRDGNEGDVEEDYDTESEGAWGVDEDKTDREEIGDGNEGDMEDDYDTESEGAWGEDDDEEEEEESELEEDEYESEYDSEGEVYEGEAGKRDLGAKYEDKDKAENGKHDVINIDYEDTVSKDKERYNTLLHWAVACGRVDILLMVLHEKHSLLNTKNSLGCTALHLAVEKSCNESVCLLLGAGADVDVRNTSGHSPVHVSIKKDNREALQSMLNVPNVNFNKNSSTGKALCMAVEKNRVECVRVLLNAKSLAGFIHRFASASLYRAAGRGHSKILEMLLEVENIDVNHREPSESTALFSAVCGRRKKCLCLLLDAKADANIPDSGDTTPLVMAATFGTSKLLEILLKIKNIDVNKQNFSGETAILRAVQFNNARKVHLLVEAKANVHIADHFGKSPLLEAANLEHRDVLKILLKFENDVSKGQSLGKALCMAVVNRNIRSVRVFIEEGANANVMGYKGMCALHHAARYGFTDALKLILASKNVEVDIKDQDGRTPLFVAMHWESNVECVRLLIDAGADVFAKHNKETLLHRVVNYHGLEYLQLILNTARKAGGEANSTRFRSLLEERNNDDHTALHVASAKCRKQCIELLLKAGSNVLASTPEGKTVLELCASDKCAYLGDGDKEECIDMLNKAVAESLQNSY